MWPAAGSRNLGGPVQRNQGTPLPSQQNPQDDIFGSSTRLPSSQGSFRFGNQSSVPQASTVDDFPPLNRNVNGDIGQERSSMMASLGFPSHPSSSSAPVPSNRAGNGLLNALSANTRSTEVRSPTTGMFFFPPPSYPPFYHPSHPPSSPSSDPAPFYLMSNSLSLPSAPPLT